MGPRRIKNNSCPQALVGFHSFFFSLYVNVIYEILMRNFIVFECDLFEICHFIELSPQILVRCCLKFLLPLLKILFLFAAFWCYLLRSTMTVFYNYVFPSGMFGPLVSNIRRCFCSGQFFPSECYYLFYLRYCQSRHFCPLVRPVCRTFSLRYDFPPMYFVVCTFGTATVSSPIHNANYMLFLYNVLSINDPMYILPRVRLSRYTHAIIFSFRVCLFFLSFSLFLFFLLFPSFRYFSFKRY